MDESIPDVDTTKLFFLVTRGNPSQIVVPDRAPKVNKPDQVLVNRLALKECDMAIGRASCFLESFRGDASASLSEIHNEQYSRVAIRGRAFSPRVPL